MNRKVRGFTLVELLVTLTLVGIVAASVLPLATVIEQRAKESELRKSLRVIRQALDDYKIAADAGKIDKPTGSQGYPPSLEVLATGVKQSSLMGVSAPPLFFLRRIPRDPFAEDQAVPPEKMWNIRAYGSKIGDYGGRGEVFDVASKSERVALDGTSYKDW